MEEIINNFVNSLPFEMHLVDPIVGKYAACGPGTKHKTRIQEYLKTGDLSHIYKNKLDAACVEHDSGYNNFKTVSERQPYDRDFIKATEEIIADQNIDGYQRAYAALINKFFSKKLGSGLTRRDENRLHKTYYDPKNGYSSMMELHRRTGIPTSDIKTCLESQDVSTRHKPAKTKF